MQIQLGDVVKLPSEDQLMTVTFIDKHGNDGKSMATCTWLDASLTPKNVRVASDSIVLVRKKEGAPSK